MKCNLWVLLYEENIKYNEDHPLCIAHCTLIKPQMGKLFYFMKYRALSREIFHLVIFITSENKMEFFSLISLEMIHVFVCCLIYSLDYLKLPANSLQFFFPCLMGLLRSWSWENCEVRSLQAVGINRPSYHPHTKSLPCWCTQRLHFIEDTYL